MNAYLLSDSEFDTGPYRKLDALVKRCLTQKGFTITEKQLEQEELNFCRGCFGCWVKTPGECVIKDAMADINRATMNADVVVYLAPVVFGQFSANMKNALDRWIPNILPFFITRADGSTMHPARYASNPQIVMIGYGDDLADEDAELFQAITMNHRENGAVLLYRGDDAATEQALLAMNLQRMGVTV